VIWRCGREEGGLEALVFCAMDRGLDLEVVGAAAGSVATTAARGVSLVDEPTSPDGCASLDGSSCCSDCLSAARCLRSD
jgi:hypothetical protein